MMSIRSILCCAGLLAGLTAATASADAANAPRTRYFTLHVAGPAAKTYVENTFWLAPGEHLGNFGTYTESSYVESCAVVLDSQGHEHVNLQPGKYVDGLGLTADADADGAVKVHIKRDSVLGKKTVRNGKCAVQVLDKSRDELTIAVPSTLKVGESVTTGPVHGYVYTITRERDAL